jgi:hypothetical protein
VKSQHASASESAPNPVDSPSTTLRGRWRVLARASWVVVAILALVPEVADLPVYFARFQTICVGTACAVIPGGQI